MKSIESVIPSRKAKLNTTDLSILCFRLLWFMKMDNAERWSDVE